MSSRDVAVGKQTCEVHRDRAAVDICASCGRTVCLSCAVPVRARVLCEACAMREIGEPAPAEPRRVVTRIPETIAAGLLGLAVLATIPPWDRFGALTTLLSAWRPSPSPWPFLASVALLAALAAALLPLWRGPRRPTRSATLAYALLAAIAAVAVVWQLFGSPDYVTHTPAPYAVALVSAGAATVGLVRLRRVP